MRAFCEKRKHTGPSYHPQHRQLTKADPPAINKREQQ